MNLSFNLSSEPNTGEFITFSSFMLVCDICRFYCCILKMSFMCNGSLGEFTTGNQQVGPELFPPVHHLLNQVQFFLKFACEVSLNLLWLTSSLYDLRDRELRGFE